MIYNLYCVVNAAGTPYGDTFNADQGKSWERHLWRDVPRDGCAPNSVSEGTFTTHEQLLKANGDRVVPVTIYTHETVITELHL